MSLYSVSIRRPVLAIVMSVAIVLFGIIGFTELGVREYPAVDPASHYRLHQLPGRKCQTLSNRRSPNLLKNR